MKFGGELNFTEVGVDGSMRNQASSTSSAIINELTCVSSQVLGIKRRIEEIHNSNQNDLNNILNLINENNKKIFSSIRRISRQPVVRSTKNILENNSKSNAVLMKNPRDLYVLWNEYEHGISGNKPAKHYTSQERGRCKYTYSLRLNFWNLVSNLIQRGHCSDIAAIQQLISEGTSKIIRAIRRDKKNGGHPKFIKNDLII